MKVTVINDLYFEGNHAGFKARYDIFNIIGEDYKKVDFYKKQVLPSKYRVLRVLSRTYINLYNFQLFKRRLKNLEDGQIILLQFPFEGLFPVALKIYKFLKIQKEKKGFKLVFLIHDLDSIRRAGQIAVQDEINILNTADVVISHNPKMTNFLKVSGIDQQKIIDLEIFDYLLENQTESVKSEKDVNVVYAGNLSPQKSNFIYKWQPNFSLNLFGILYEPKLSSNSSNYLGVFDPSYPTLNSIGNSFGLVWDGDSIETCTGLTGNYLKYNNPHKISLYLSQGLPVIVWKESALSDFVIKHSIGIVINNLEELNHVLTSLPYDEYLRLVKNVEPIQKNLINGFYFRKAFDEAITKIVNHHN